MIKTAFLPHLVLILLAFVCLSFPNSGWSAVGNGPNQYRSAFLKIDSATGATAKMHWPYVYPHDFKISFEPGIHPAGLPDGSKVLATTYGLALEFLWTQVLFYGPAYELNIIPANEQFKEARIHRFALNTGIIVLLDDYEKHHILLYLRPGYSQLRTSKGNVSQFGVGLGVGYEYNISSRYIVSPQIFYYRYPKLENYPYGLSGWMFSLRFTYGK